MTVNNSKHLILIFFSLCLFATSCSNDNEPEETKISFSSTTPETITSYLGGQFTVDLNSDGFYSNIEDYYLFYIGDMLVPQENISSTNIITENGVHITEATITIPSSWEKFSEKRLTIHSKKTGLMATGPIINLQTPYRYFTGGSLGLLNVKLQAVDASNQVVTCEERTPHVKKKMTIEFKGFNADQKPNIENGWTALPFPMIGDHKAAAFIPDGNSRPNALSTRDGITYISMPYTERNSPTFYTVVQEYKRMMAICGDAMYDNPKFNSQVLDIEQDKNNKLFFRLNKTPNAIYRMSEMDAPVLWAGSETEGDTKDGTLLNARFADVVGMDRDTDDNIYVAQKNTIRKVTPQGIVTTLTDFGFENIQVFTVAPDNRIYIIDSKNQSQVAVIDAQHKTVSRANILSGFTSTKGSVYNTKNIGVSADGVIYFTEYVGSGEMKYYLLVPADWKAN